MVAVWMMMMCGEGGSGHAVCSGGQVAMTAGVPPRRPSTFDIFRKKEKKTSYLASYFFL